MIMMIAITYHVSDHHIRLKNRFETIIAGSSDPRTSTVHGVFNATLESINANAIPQSSSGEYTPLDTNPTTRPLTFTSIPGTVRRLPSSRTPWTLVGVPETRAALISSEPMNDFVFP